MSTNTNKKTYTAKSVAIAIAPYIVIWTMIVIAGGVMLGWTLRSGDIARVQGESSQLVQDLAAELKK